MVITYTVKNGRVVRSISKGRSTPKSEPPPDRHFSQTLLRAYYQLECEQGSRFRSTYTKNQIKRAHDTAIARFEQTGAQT